jgi:hypothetical protein
VRTWPWRLAPLAALGTAAAVAVVAIVASGGPPGARSQGHPPAGSHQVGAPRPHTIAYIARRTQAALISEASGTLRVTQANQQGQIYTQTADLSSGASRLTTRRASDGALLQDAAWTAGPDATTTTVDYTTRSWWTAPGGGADILAYATDPQTLHRFMTEGALVFAGNGTVNGQPAIHLHFPSTIFKDKGRLGGVSETDIWVSATTFPPIREVGINGFWSADLSWSAQPPAPADLTITPPAGSPTSPGRRPAAGASADRGSRSRYVADAQAASQSMPFSSAYRTSWALLCNCSFVSVL